MNALKRIRRIMSANINHIIDKAEDPEQMVKQLIREMDESIVALRMEVARSVSAEKRLAAQVADARQGVQKWTGNSEKALARGDEELAREAICRRLDVEEGLPELSAQHEKAVRTSKRMKSELHALEDKVQSVRRRKELLVARRRRAQAQKGAAAGAEKVRRLADEAEDIFSDREIDPDDVLANAEGSVAGLEADAEAGVEMLDARSERELESVFEGMDRSERVEDALRELKKKVGE